MTERSAEAHGAWDRAQITDLIHTYAQAADAGDFERLLTCFAPDARLQSAQGVREGLEAIAESMSPAALARARAASSGLQFDASTHQMSNIIITVAGDTAHAESSAVAFLVGTQDGRRVLVMRGLTYTDDFVRRPEGWRIKSRIHRAVWQSEPAPAGQTK